MNMGYSTYLFCRPRILFVVNIHDHALNILVWKRVAKLLGIITIVDFHRRFINEILYRIFAVSSVYFVGYESTEG